jgi:hypothetical protein
LREVNTIASGSGNKEVVDARGARQLVVVPGTSGTITYSVVDTLDAAAHGYNQTGPSTASAIVTIDVKGLFYMIECATASCEVHFII